MDQGSVAFVLLCAALAFLAGLASPLLYGPVDRRGSADSIGLIGFSAVAVVALLAVMVGFAEAFGSRLAPGFVGIPGVLGIDLDLVGLESAIEGADTAALALVAFQCALASAVAGLLASALTERLRLLGAMAFVAVYAVLVYFPVLGWALNLRWSADGLRDGGWLASDLAAMTGAGVLDFAGALPIHVAGGAAVLAIWAACPKPPAEQGAAPAAAMTLPRSVVGGALLWFAWLGVVAGAEGAADGFASLAMMNTIVTPAGAMLAWLVTERAATGRSTSAGAASGAVSGLVAVTVGAAYLSPVASLLLGVVTGGLCSFAARLLSRRLPGAVGRIVAIHLVGGAFSVISLGIVADGVGFVFSGSPAQLVAQSVGVATTAGYSFLVAFLLAFIIARLEATLHRAPAGRRTQVDAP